VERLRSREPAAFSVLVSRLSGRLMGIAYGILKDWPDSEDVVQETWLAVYFGLEHYREHGSLEAWIASIARNKSIRRYHNSRREVSSPSETLATLVDRAPSYRPLWCGSFVFSSLDRIQAADALRRIQREFAALPPKQALSVAMSTMGEEPSEIDRRLQVSESNRRVLLHRARTRLRRALRATSVDQEP
ncbi:MAG: RNA polymerase sigma factor, partial [Myxococcota bacterium]